MIHAILKFELKYWMKNPATYLYAAILFLFAFFSIAGAAGLFQGDISHQTLIANSPFALYQLSNVGFKLMLFVIPSMLGLSLSRDYQFQVHSLMYSYPIARSQFLIAKFMAPFLIIVILWTCFILGCFLATKLPGLEATLLLPFDLKVYFKLLIVYLLPNSLLISLIVFLINVLSRKQFPGFISIIVLLIIRETGIRLSSGFELNDLSLILEPFAELATSASTRYWDIAEQNALNIPLSSIVILNRCLVLLVCVFLAITSYRNFNFHQEAPSFLRIFKKKFRSEIRVEKEPGRSISFPFFEFGKGLFFRINQSWKLSFYELKSIVKSRAFILVLVFGTLLGFVLQAQINTPYGIKVWPLTWVMLAFPVLFYKIFIAFISFFYAGILINKAKQEDMFCLIDATSIHNWVLYSSKLLALIKIQMLILSCIFLSGILVQSMNSYYDFELHHYAFDLYCIHLPEMIIWGILALFIHTIISNTWIGLFTLALLYFGVSELPMIGIEQWIFRFNENPDPGFYLHYSDLSGYSHSLKAYFIFKVYWFIFSGILMAITLLVWKRGLIFSVKEFLRNIRQRFQGKLVFAASFLFIGFLSAGIWIHFQYRNSEIPSAEQIEIIEKESDKKWAHLEILPQPRIIGVKVNMDIYPEEFKFTSSGQYSMVNLSSSPIDSILVRTSHEVSTKFELDKSYSITLNDPDSKFNILKLECPLLPGDTVKLNFQLKSIDNTIFQKNNPVEKNGTYITSLIYPAIGYRSSKTDRKAHEEGATDNHYRSFDSDFISLELLVSTSEDQTAIAPGYLEKSYIERGRKFFKYISKSPVTSLLPKWDSS
ncbi:MAG: hypothetical protein IPI60_17660 [Saprospiraceae bacterium]|nr:hypothetical protein [Saprospiraceae bacterium]